MPFFNLSSHYRLEPECIEKAVLARADSGSVISLRINILNTSVQL